ncbi:MAG: hypothetical protein ACI8RD_012420 [Bacillariaceae sp.]|jgi:hypothetical protein
MENNNESLQNQQPMAMIMATVSNDIPATSKVKAEEDVVPATIAAAAAAAPSLTTSMSIDTTSSDPSYIPNSSSTTAPTLGAANTKNKRKRPIPSPTASLQDATSMDLADNDNEDEQEQEEQALLLSRIGKDGEPLSEKKLRRLEKNRLSARECRRRKREATENMQRQINILEGENLRLRLQLQVSKRLILVIKYSIDVN